MQRFRPQSSLSAFSRYFSATAAVKVDEGPGANAVCEAIAATSSASKRDGNQTLGKQLLSLVYAKRSAVITSANWKEQGNEVRKYELTRIVREFRKLKRFKHALEICEGMTLQQDDMKLLAGDYAVHLDLIAKVRGLNSAEKRSLNCSKDMKKTSPDACSYNQSVVNFMQNDVDTAMKVFLELKKARVVPDWVKRHRSLLRKGWTLE